MDRRFLEYYNRELAHIRELGGEFAREYPKVAGRLALDSFECADPYVERLLEGFAFLAARTQLKIDAEFPRFTEHLLQMVHPQYLCPTPSMAVVAFSPSAGQALDNGFVLARGTALKSVGGRGDATACEYRTAHEVTLWPIEIASISHGPYSADLGDLRLPSRKTVKGVVRLRLRTLNEAPIGRLPLDKLALYIRGQDPVASRLHELLLARSVGMLVRDRGRTWAELASGDPVAPLGFDDNEALLPVGARSFQGYRVLQEYFAFPSRFMFVELRGLGPVLRRCQDTEVDIVVLLDRYDPSVESGVTTSHVALHATPAVNLFPHRANRIHLSDRVNEYHVVADRTRPLDLEVHSVAGVQGFGTSAEVEREFLPFYGITERMLGHHEAYYTVHRQPRPASSRQKLHGPRSSYLGHEVFVALVDGQEGPFRSDLRQLSVDTLCTNRDLPLAMSIGTSSSDFTVQTGAPVDKIVCLAGPSPPRPSHAWGETSWRLIGHLTANYLAIADRGAAPLRELLELYADANEHEVRRQINGIQSLQAAPILRRLATRPPTMARGIELTLSCDEAAFEGMSVFLLGSVLERFFAKFVSMNSLTETVLRTIQRGEVARWPTRIGRRPIA